jgi:hypothetical protein
VPLARGCAPARRPAGTIGPDLDDLHPKRERVLAAIRNGGLGGVMPAGLLGPRSARRVAAYVARVAGARPDSAGPRAGGADRPPRDPHRSGYPVIAALAGEPGLGMMRAMRRGSTWILTVLLAIAGSQAAHAAAYRVQYPGHAEHEHALSATGHGYLDHLPLFAAVAVAIAVVALALRVRAGAGARPRAWPFAVLAPLVFALQEQLERAAAGAADPIAAAAEPTFVLGLALQLPLGVLAFAIARALVSIADRIAVALERPAPAPRGARALPRPPAVVRFVRVSPLALAGAERGPPAGLR